MMEQADVLENLCSLLANALELERVDPDDEMCNLGIGSLNAVLIAAEMEQERSLPVSPALFFQAATPRELVRLATSEGIAESDCSDESFERTDSS
eukprot:CAMPEP_0196742670 /NCGR_PEP_ID=MMETSP1091-20130531/48153_1 /TAXON_ID=302021 /ORGANISM="Rhodomonas sp., Strain CCMP768" /LENGTH=94 /DNA_ID=CAMNT_0042088791 /DNA_START=31 /DNA_END=312 /DNA_ORIENTATION=+